MSSSNLSRGLGWRRFLLGPLLALSLSACYSAPRYTPRAGSVPDRRPPTRPVEAPKPKPEGSLLRTYQGAREYYDLYRRTRSPKHGEAAIEIFRNYLQDSPFGSYSPMAHLYKARLHCELSQKREGIAQLRAFTSHPRAAEQKFLELARFVFEICDQH